jgi:hypothetical protein
MIHRSTSIQDFPGLTTRTGFPTLLSSSSNTFLVSAQSTAKRPLLNLQDHSSPGLSVGTLVLVFGLSSSSPSSDLFSSLRSCSFRSTRDFPVFPRMTSGLSIPGCFFVGLPYPTLVKRQAIQCFLESGCNCVASVSFEVSIFRLFERGLTVFAAPSKSSCCGGIS